MAMVGVGVGMNAGPLVIHARFKKPNHIAITNAMMNFVCPPTFPSCTRTHPLYSFPQFRSLGGTVGLAQCFTILNARVNAYIASRLASLALTLSPADLDTLTSLLDSGGLSSVTSLDGFSTAVQDVVRDAFQDGVRWCFVSLIPWLGVACVLSVFLSRIGDSDEEAKTQGAGKGGREEGEKEGEGEGEQRAWADGDVEAGAEISSR